MVINSNTTSTPASLRRSHRGMALSMIEAQPGASRSDLAHALGFSEMAATRIVRELLSVGIVEEFEGKAPSDNQRKRVGRPKTGLRVVPHSLYAVGITVSAYHSEVSISDAAGDIQATRAITNPSFASVEGAAQIYARALKELIDETEIEKDRIVGIGVALSARTDPQKGEILRSEYFGWSNDQGAFCDELRKILDLPVEIENISNAIATAEMRFGAARASRNFSLVHVATFVGASVVSEGGIVRGGSGFSGLIGHIRSQKTDLTCVCGRDDCLNLNATGFGLLSRLGKLDQPAFSHERLSFYAASLLGALEGNAAAGMVEEAGKALAPTIDSMGKILGPDMIILSGHLGADPAYFHGVQSALEADFGYGTIAPFPLVRGTIKPEKSAALLALHAFCYSNRLDYDRLVELSERRSDQNG